MQLINQQKEHVEFADRSEPSRDLAKSPAKLPRHVMVELKNRYQFAQPPARDTRAVQCGDIAFGRTIDGRREMVEVLAEKIRSSAVHGV